MIMEEKLLKYIDQNCQNEDFEKNTLDQISEKFQIGRNQCALLLKSLINQKKLTRIEEKPYKYLTTEYLHKKGKSMVETSYSSLETALQKQELHDFEKLIGHEQSLREIVKQCKATIAYPPEGLPLLLYGATGTGKSYIAQLTYEWAKNNNIIKASNIGVKAFPILSTNLLGCKLKNNDIAKKINVYTKSHNLIFGFPGKYCPIDISNAKLAFLGIAIPGPTER